MNAPVSDSLGFIDTFIRYVKDIMTSFSQECGRRAEDRLDYYTRYDVQGDPATLPFLQSLMLELDMDPNTLETLEEQKIDILRENFENQKIALRGLLTELKRQMWRDVPVIVRNDQASAPSNFQDDQNRLIREQQQELLKVRKENNEFKKRIEDLNKTVSIFTNERMSHEFYYPFSQLRSEDYTKKFIDYSFANNCLIDSDFDEESQTTLSSIQGYENFFQRTNLRRKNPSNLSQDLNKVLLREKKDLREQVQAESQEKNIILKELQSEAGKKFKIMKENESMSLDLQTERQKYQNLTEEFTKVSQDLQTERINVGNAYLEQKRLEQALEKMATKGLLTIGSLSLAQIAAGLLILL